MRALVVAVVVVLAGCGRLDFALQGGAGDDVVGDDDPPDEIPFVGDPEGFWNVVDGRVTGEPAVRLASDLQNGIRGNVLIASSMMHERHLLLARGAQGGFSAGSSTFELHGARAIVSDGEIVAALLIGWNGPDDMTLTWDASDPITRGTLPLETIHLSRAIAPPLSLVGHKMLTRVAYQGLPEFPANTCGPDVGGDSQIVVGAIEITERLLVNVDFDFQFFDGASCTGASDTLESTGSGYLEVDGSQYRLWLALDGYTDTAATAGTIAITASSIRLVRTSCSPAASLACTDLPLAIETTP